MANQKKTNFYDYCNSEEGLAIGQISGVLAITYIMLFGILKFIEAKGLRSGMMSDTEVFQFIGIITGTFCLILTLIIGCYRWRAAGIFGLIGITGAYPALWGFVGFLVCYVPFIGVFINLLGILGGIKRYIAAIDTEYTAIVFFTIFLLIGLFYTVVFVNNLATILSGF